MQSYYIKHNHLLAYITVPCNNIHSLNFSLWWKVLIETLKYASRVGYMWIFSDFMMQWKETIELGLRDYTTSIFIAKREITDWI